MTTDERIRAKTNRQMVANKENILGYQRVEAALRATPFGGQLPSFVPIGELPYVDLKRIRPLQLAEVK